MTLDPAATAELPPRKRDRPWREVSADEAMARLAEVADGGRVWVSSSSGTPHGLLRALSDARKRFSALELVVAYLLEPLAPFEYAGAPFRFTSLQATGVLEPLLATGTAVAVSCRYSDAAPLLAPGAPLDVDAALVQVSPRGPEGRYSLGTSVGINAEVVRSAPLVIAQVNAHMPYTFGAGELEPGEIDLAVPLTEPLLELLPAPSTPEAERIAKHAATEIPDGATLQFGVGTVPEAILRALDDHRDLGVHGGMVSDACIDLVECGALTGAEKTTDPGRIVAAEAIGSRRLYDWIDRNPLVQMAPARYTHGLATLVRQNRFTAINSAVEVALDGSVNAETVGGRRISGPGGQPDFAAAALAAPGGIGLTALPATAARGTVSRIVGRLAPGAAVTLAPWLVDRVVTEHGIARLRGLDPAARARALRLVAEPRFCAPLDDF